MQGEALENYTYWYLLVDELELVLGHVSALSDSYQVRSGQFS
jgi:hypothetical protein